MKGTEYHETVGNHKMVLARPYLSVFTLSLQSKGTGWLEGFKNKMELIISYLITKYLQNCRMFTAVVHLRSKSFAYSEVARAGIRQLGCLHHENYDRAKSNML